MSNVKLMFLSFIVAGILISLTSTTTNAQSGFPANLVQQYTNQPCTDPYVSWALRNRSEGWHDKGTSGECNRTNYGAWNTASELLAKLDTYRYDQHMRANGISLKGGFQGRDGNQYLVFQKGSAMLGMNVGRFLGHDAANGSTLVSTNGGNVVAQGAGNVVDMKLIMDQGGAKILGNSSAGVVAQGAGNVVAQGAGNAQRRVLAVGDTLFQFPNRYAVVSGRK
jgi:hypothetical protein